jgi:hypothetical protein
MTTKKLFYAAVLVSSTLLLSACHNSNPLLTQNKKETVQFILNAQNYASEQTHLYDSVGSVYLDCLNNPLHFSNPFAKQNDKGCENIFKQMLIYAKKTKHFSSLSLNNLKDKQVEKRVGKAVFFKD